MSKDEFTYKVMGKISHLFDIANQLYYINDIQFHNIMQNQIYCLGKELGYFPQKDYCGKINVVWYTKNKNLLCSFQIGSLFTNGAAEKLNRSNALVKFWLYYGESDIPYTKKIINDYDIHIIRKRR